MPTTGRTTIKLTRPIKTAFVKWAVETLTTTQGIFRAEAHLDNTGRLQSIVSILYQVPTAKPTLGEVRLSSVNGLHIITDANKDMSSACGIKAEWSFNSGYKLWLTPEPVLITITESGTRRVATEEETTRLFDALLEKVLCELHATATLSKNGDQAKLSSALETLERLFPVNDTIP